MQNEDVLFSRFWDNLISKDKYYISPLPGSTDSLSSSCLSSLNVGVNKYISSEQQKAAFEVLKFFFSEKIQKKILTEYQLNISMKRLYDDKEVCEQLEQSQYSITCDLMKKMKFILRPTHQEYDYDRFSSKYQLILKKYLNGTITSAKDAVEDIYNISYIYFIEVNSFVSLFVLIINNIITLSMIISFALIFTKRNKDYFKFLKKRYWLLFIIGLFLVSCYPYTGINKLSRFKCYIRPIIISIGFTVSFTPIVLKMIINFPLENKISHFIDRHYFSFILVFVLIDIISFIIYSISPLVVRTYFFDDKLNFQKCEPYSKLGQTIILGMVTYKGIILCIMAFFLFIEWNIEETREDIRSFTAILYANLLSIFLYIMICSIDVENYHIYYLLRVGPIFCYTITNLLMAIGIRLYYANFKKDSEQEILERILFRKSTKQNANNYYNNNNNYSKNISANKSGKSVVRNMERDPSSIKRETLKSLVMNFHFATGRGSPRDGGSGSGSGGLFNYNDRSSIDDGLASSSYNNKGMLSYYKNDAATSYRGQLSYKNDMSSSSSLN